MNPLQMLCFPRVVRPLLTGGRDGTGGQPVLQAFEPVLMEVVATETVCATSFLFIYAHSHGKFIYTTAGKRELAKVSHGFTNLYHRHHQPFTSLRRCRN